MSLTDFLQALAGLVYIPDAERTRVSMIAERVPDTERIELLRYLQGINGQIEGEMVVQKSFLDEAEKLLAETEHSFQSLQRDEAENTQRAVDMKAAEDRLSSQV